MRDHLERDLEGAGAMARMRGEIEPLLSDNFEDEVFTKRSGK
jgi:hypothetical protein